MITAISAAVNGGRLLTPYIVKEIRDGNGEVIRQGSAALRVLGVSICTVFDEGL